MKVVRDPYLFCPFFQLAGEVVLRHSCTKEGFKNAKKSTTIAAQTTGMSLGNVSIKVFLLIYVKLVIIICIYIYITYLLVRIFC